MQRDFSISQTKRNFSSIVHEVEEGSSVRLTRRGKPVAVLLSIHEYERLNQEKPESDFLEDRVASRQTIGKEGIETRKEGIETSPRHS